MSEIAASCQKTAPEVDFRGGAVFAGGHDPQKGNRRDVPARIHSVSSLIYSIISPTLAIENPAKHLYGMGADAFVALQAGDLRGADVMLLDEGVL